MTQMWRIRNNNIGLICVICVIRGCSADNLRLHRLGSDAMKFERSRNWLLNSAPTTRRQLSMRLIFSAVILLLGTSSFAFGQYKKGSIEDQLIQLDRAWTFAELKGDKKAAGELVADDYVGTTQRGAIENKTQYLAGVTPNSDMVKADDYKVTIYGNTAIMTHRATVEGVRNIQFRSTHVWMKRKGKWQIVAHHGSMIAPPDKEDDQ